MDSKTHLLIIQKKEPLGQYEQVMVAEMTWNEAIQKASKLLSPTVAPSGEGTAFSVRISEFRLVKHWVYIPQWV